MSLVRLAAFAFGRTEEEIAAGFKKGMERREAYRLQELLRLKITFEIEFELELERARARILPYINDDPIRHNWEAKTDWTARWPEPEPMPCAERDPVVLRRDARSARRWQKKRERFPRRQKHTASARAPRKFRARHR